MATQLVQECPYCLTERSGFEPTDGYAFDGGGNREPTTWINLWMCRTCREGIITKFKHQKLGGSHSPTQGLGDPRENGFDLIDIQPKIEKHEAPDHVPEGISRDFNEAQDSLRRRNWTSAGMMFRKVLQRATTAIAGPEMTLSHNLLARIDMLAERHLMTPAMREWAHVIRLDGNEAAHKEDRVFTEQQATQMRDFTELLLIYAFTLPARVQAHREQTERSPSQ